MPEYYNVIQASKYIGADPKTVRRWLKQGKMTALRTERGWLAIPEDQVERMRIEWENERTRFAVPMPPHASLDRQPRASLDNIRRLEDRIAVLEEIVAAQTESIEALEKTLSNASLPVPTSPYTEALQSQNRALVNRIDEIGVQPQQSPLLPSTRPSSPIPADLPDGTLTSTQFRKQLGIEKVDMDSYIQRGVFGEPFPMTRIPHPTREGYTLTYFSPDEQERAIALLKRHGKI